MEPPSDSTLIRSAESEGIDMKEFCKIVAEYMDLSNWCAVEMAEAFSIFDKDGNGYLDAIELKRVFTKLGENLTDLEMEDQVGYSMKLRSLCRHLTLSFGMSLASRV